MSFFVLLVPLAYSIGIRYNIPNEAWIGACFVPSGFGTMVGAGIVGRISDHTVIAWRKKRKGVWYPEDRLKVALVPYAIIMPASLVGFGLANQFIAGTPGLAICLLCLFMNGIGVEMAFEPCAGYLVDVLHSRSARCKWRAPFRSNCRWHHNNPSDDKCFWVAITNAIFAVFVLISFGILQCVIRYGDQMRAWHDVGFSTAENN